MLHQIFDRRQAVFFLHRGIEPREGRTALWAVRKGAPKARRKQTRAKRSGWRIPLCSTMKDQLSSLNELSFSFYQQELAQFSTRKRTKILGLYGAPRIGAHERIRAQAGGSRLSTRTRLLLTVFSGDG